MSSVEPDIVRLPPVLPWHAAQWQSLASAMANDRLHHALLLQGPGGVGKYAFAQRVSAALLCEAPIDAPLKPCEQCRSCVLVRAGNHPDRLHLAPKEDKRVIDVEQVRTRAAELSLTPHYASRRVIIVAPADSLNRSAANTLLKTLEEPPGGVVFLLVSERSAMLPATIRSRCSTLRFHAPAHDVARQWLAAQGVADASLGDEALYWSGGAPLAALAALQGGEVAQCQELVSSLGALVSGATDPLQAAAAWRVLGIRNVVRWQLRIATQVMRINALGGAAGGSVAMQGLGSRLDLAQMESVCDELLELQNALERQLNPGDQLALEGLAVTWRDAALKAA